MSDTDDSFLAEADLTEDFGSNRQQERRNPLDGATSRAMDGEDFDRDDLDEEAWNGPDFFFDDPFSNVEQLAAAQAAFEDLAQRNLNLGSLDAALGLGPVPPAAEEERTRTYPERYQEFVTNNEERILAYLRSLPDPSAHMAKEA